MKISELIEHLEDIKDCSGDLEVEVSFTTWGKVHYTSLDEDFFTVDKDNNTLQLG